MDWPRFQLTPEESRRSSKYENPNSPKQRVLRRIYYNELNITPALRLDAVQFQISRRSRVFGITAAGDIEQFMIELIDSTGEQYTAGPVHLTNLLLGYNPDPMAFDGISYPGIPPNVVIATATDMGPFIQEPNIVLSPNQTLNINVTSANPTNIVSSFRIGLCLHVYEFPGMAGSPL